MKNHNEVKLTEVQETEPQYEVPTFTELLMREIYKAVMAELDADDRRELSVYEYDFDFGTPTHAETKEQYDWATAKIIEGAVKYVLDMYVIHTEDELMEKDRQLPIGGRFDQIIKAEEVTAIRVTYTIGDGIFDEPAMTAEAYFTKDGRPIGKFTAN